MNPKGNYSLIVMINPIINDDLRSIMISDQDNQANTRYQDEKKLKIESFTKIGLCLGRKQDNFIL